MKYYHKEGHAPHYQGNVIEKETGRTVAVTYDDEGGDKAKLFAMAPELARVLLETRNTLLYLVQEVEARAGCPKPIIGGARYHAGLATNALREAGVDV